MFFSTDPEQMEKAKKVVFISIFVFLFLTMTFAVFFISKFNKSIKSPPPQWEYVVRTINFTSGESQELQDSLNVYGNQGWALVSVANEKGQNLYIFRKAMSSQ